MDRGQLAPTVIPHMNADLGYDDPAILPRDYRTNRINVEGLKSVTFSSGTASPILVEGLQGWNDPAVTNQALVPIHTDMTRVEVANELDRVLEQLFHNPTLITQSGLNYNDGDTFVIEDGVHAPVIYEFDSGYVLAVPIGGGAVADGGIEDGDYFTIRDSAGLVSATFEFDKDGRLTLSPGTSTAVPIKETDSSLSVARTIVQVLQNHPLRASLNLTPRLLTNSRVQVGGSRGAQLTINPGSSLTLEAARPGTAPSATLQLPATLAMQLPDPLTIHVPPSGILDGETFVLSDGSTSVTFEFENIIFGNGVAAGNRAVPFAPRTRPRTSGGRWSTKLPTPACSSNRRCWAARATSTWAAAQPSACKFRRRPPTACARSGRCRCRSRRAAAETSETATTLRSPAERRTTSSNSRTPSRCPAETVPHGSVPF